MREVYSGNIVVVSCMRLALMDAGIDCMATDCVRWNTDDNHPVPTLYVQDADYEKASAFIAQSKKKASESWVCPNCGERVPASFEACWNCKQIEGRKP